MTARKGEKRFSSRRTRKQRFRLCELLTPRFHGSSVWALLQARASIDVRDADGDSALLVGHLNGHPDIVELILQHKVVKGVEDQRARVNKEIIESEISYLEKLLMAVEVYVRPLESKQVVRKRPSIFSPRSRKLTIDELVGGKELLQIANMQNVFVRDLNSEKDFFGKGERKPEHATHTRSLL